jgi:predicted nuclease of predicted toxin-antitoxin system
MGQGGMKFLADMGISLRTVQWLRDQGFDTVHLRDQGLQLLPDREIIEKAYQENRIILTVDLDFPQLLATSKRLLPSVVLFRLGNENYDLINDRLSIILQECREVLEAGAIISVTDRMLRIRLLPV